VISIDRLLTNINQRGRATDTAVAAAEEELGLKLPADFVQFLKSGNGGEGFIGRKYVIFWGVEELPSINESYEVQQCAPGLLIFASSGGGEAYGFDTRKAPWPVVRVPFIGMEWGVAEIIGRSFSEFLVCLHEAG